MSKLNQKTREWFEQYAKFYFRKRGWENLSIEVKDGKIKVTGWSIRIEPNCGYADGIWWDEGTKEVRKSTSAVIAVRSRILDLKSGPYTRVYFVDIYGRGLHPEDHIPGIFDKEILHHLKEGNFSLEFKNI